MYSMGSILCIEPLGYWRSFLGRLDTFGLFLTSSTYFFLPGFSFEQAFVALLRFIELSSFHSVVERLSLPELLATHLISLSSVVVRYGLFECFLAS